MKKIYQSILPTKKPKPTPLQQLQPYFTPDGYMPALQCLTCLGVTYAENLCAAWLEYVKKGWKAQFHEGLMQCLYEVGVEVWLKKPQNVTRGQVPCNVKKKVEL